MRPEKSKLLKVSLCVLSCVFFGCGENKPKSNGTETVLSSKAIKAQLENNTRGKDLQTESPFMKILSNAMQTVLNRDSDDVKTLEKYLNKDGSIKEDKVGDFEKLKGEELDKFVGALENVLVSIRDEFKTSLKNYDFIDSFGKTEEAIKEWNKSGFKNKEVMKVVSAWEVIYHEYDKFDRDPLQYLIVSGKGWFHRSTVKAIDLAWRNFVEFLEQGCGKCENALKSFVDKNKEAAEEAEKVIIAISEQKDKIRNFVEDKNSIRVKTLGNVYALLGNKFLFGHGDAFFKIVNCKNTDIKDADFKVPTDWGNVVFSHLYLGVKSNRRSFSNPACALYGKTMEKLKSVGYNGLFEEKFSNEYDSILKDFVKFAIEKNIISEDFFNKENVDVICKYLENYKSSDVNSGRSKIALSPWLMQCAQNKWEEINKIVKFVQENEDSKEKWAVKIIEENTTFEKLIKADKNYEKLEIYAGILGICNLFVGLESYKDGKEDKGNGFKVSKNLKTIAQNKSILNNYALKGRLKQWDDFKTAAEKGKLDEGGEKVKNK